MPVSALPNLPPPPAGFVPVDQDLLTNSAVHPVQPGAVATGGLNPSPPALSWQGAVQHPAAFAGQVFERTFDLTGAIRESAEATLKGIPQAAKSLLGGAQSVVGTVEDINNLTSRVGTRLTGKPDLNSRALSKRIADINVSIKKPDVTSPSLQEGLADPRLLGRAVGGVVGSSAVPMAATIGAGVVGGIPGATIVSTMLNAGDVFNTLTDAGINANEAALTAGLSMAALDAIVPLRALGLWNKKGLEQAIKAGIAKTPKSVIRTWAKEAALEGATETAQEGIAAGTEAAHGIKQPNLFWRLVNAGLGGTMIGFGVGAAGRPSAAETTVAPPPRFEPMGPPAPPPAAPAPVVEASAPPPPGFVPVQPRLSNRPQPLATPAVRMSGVSGGPPTPTAPLPAPVAAAPEIQPSVDIQPPAGDMVIQTPEGPQVADSAQVLTDKVLTVAEEAPEVKPAVPQSTLDKWDAEGKAADDELRQMGLFTGGRASMGAFLDPKVISKMALSIRGDVARFVIHAGNAVEKIVAKFGEDYRPIAVQVFEEARKLAGMPSAAPPVSSGAPAAVPASVTATPLPGSPQGQPPPLPTEPRDMPSLRTEGLTTSQRINIGIRTVGTINRNNLQFRQMAEQNPDFQPIQDQLAAKNRMDRTIQNWKNKGGDAMEEWNALGEERGRQLSDFNYTVQDWTQRANRPLTEQEVMQLADKAGLDEETVTVYQRQQQTFREFWEGLRQAEVSELEREIKDPEALASAIATLNKEVDEKARRNYFPLMRFGDWMVTSYLKTDDPQYPSGKKVHRHEQYASEKAAEEAATRMERDYAAAGIVPENVTVGELSPEVRDMGHLPPSIAERLASKLNLTDKQRAAFDDMMASTMVERSGRQHQKYREGIPGYSRDGKRTAGAYFSAMSNLIGRTAERGNILQAVNDARTYRKNLRAETPGQFVNLTKINHMIEFMDDAAKNQISPKVHSNTLSGAMMLWWLGYNPKQILLNFTQLGQGVAVLADQVGPDGGKVGIPAATAQMLKAIRDVSHAYSKRVFSKDKHKVVGAPGDQQNYIGNLTREEWEALENARLSGLVGETNAKMVTQHAKTSTLEKLGGRISGISGEEAGRKRDEQLAHLAEGSMAGFQWSEEWLRRTILVASGRAMKAKGSANPWGTAEQVVRSSQGSHEASNRSKLQRDWPKTLIFKSFLLNNAYLGTLSPYRRKIWLAQLLLAGLTGGFAMEHFFQLIDTLGSLFNWHFFGMKNPRVDLQHAIREWVNWGAGKASVPGAGPYASEFLLKGLAGGIPGNPWDLQASTSQGKALPFIEQFLDLINGTTTPQNALWKTAEDITGLAGSTAMNATKALVEDSPTSENIIRTVMPKAASQPLQALRALAAGGVRDSKGAKLITLDPSKPRDVIEIAGMAAGIQPKRLTQAREQKWAPKELNLYYDNLLRGLQNDYNKARATKDPQVIRAMNKEIIRINREVLPQGFNRTLGEYLANYQNRNKGLRKEERGVPPGAVRRRGYVKGYMGAYGERAQ